jgi:hypothetical protein
MQNAQDSFREGFQFDGIRVIRAFALAVATAYEPNTQ